MFTKKLITCGLSPNLEFQDVALAFQLLFSPHQYKLGEYAFKGESWFKEKFSVKFAYSFASGREAEYAIFSSLDIKKGDEVIVQAFTCAAVIFPILAFGAKPVYVDIDKNTYSLDLSDLEQKISNKTKAVIVQHTFGIPADIEKIKIIAKKKNLFVIEDCAHVIGGKVENKLLGTFGDAAFFSFGRDKAVSSVFGGIAVTNNKSIGEKLKSIQANSSYPSSLWIAQQLLHPILTWIVLLLFRMSPLLGKIMIGILKNSRILSSPVNYWEQTSEVKQFPNALALLCLSQLSRIDRFNKRRVEIYNLYRQHLQKIASISKDIKFPEHDAYFLRIPIRVKEKNELPRKNLRGIPNGQVLLSASSSQPADEVFARKNKFIQIFKKDLIYLGDWYSYIIDPKGSAERVKYRKGECTVAEKTSTEIVNLPCNPTLKDEDVERVLQSIDRFYENERV